MRSAALVAAGILVGATVVVAAGGCRGRASPDDCRAMTEHYLDLAVAESKGADGMSPDQKRAVRDVERGLKRAEPSYRRVEDDCAHVTRAEVSCAEDAPSTQAWEACLAAPDGGRR